MEDVKELVATLKVTFASLSVLASYVRTARDVYDLLQVIPKV